MKLHGHQCIGGGTSHDGEATIRGVDPSTGSVMDPPFFEATEGEIDRALQLAEQSFEGYRRKSPEQIAGFLDAVTRRIEALGDALIDRAMKETGLPEARLTMERGRTVNQIRMFAKVVAEGSWVDARIDHADPDRKPLPKPDVRRMLISIGPVVVFGASNFPLAFSVAGGDTASALAAGCPVVFKAHPAHPGTSELVATAVREAADEAGIPEGVFSLLHGKAPQVSLALVRHPLTRAVGFTGSLRAGRALFDAAAARDEPIPVYAEMGSVNPVFVLPGALRERGEQIAGGLAQSATLGVGQFCTKPGMVVALDDDATEQFIRDTGSAIENTAPGTMLHAGICDAYRTRIDAVRKLDAVRVAGEAKQPADTSKTQAAAVLLTADADTFGRHASLHDEIFGPATLIVTCDSRPKMLKMARDLSGHLTCTVHATDEDLDAFADLLAILERKAGRIIRNGFPTGVEVCAAMHHGGPYPATTDVRSTSVGTAAIQRFARPVCYQGLPAKLLPAKLHDDNPLKISRLVDGEWSRDGG